MKKMAEVTMASEEEYTCIHATRCVQTDLVLLSRTHISVVVLVQAVRLALRKMKAEQRILTKVK